MNIVVIGATGMAGSAIVADAASRGHHVTAVSRGGQGTDTVHDHDHVTAVALDVAATDATDHLTRILADADADIDAVVLAVRPAPGSEHLMASMTAAVLDAAGRAGIRVVVVGGSAPLRSPDDPDRLVIDDTRYIPEAWRPIAGASLDQFRVCLEHPRARWTYLSPPAVFAPGEDTGGYRRGTTTLLTDEHGQSRVTPADLALAVVDEIEEPGDDPHITVVGR
ncbi:NAD(P)-dependent oxidoreductase [Corynebacterium kalidii]|uniref:NAD(P)H-binding protein n=1 Tax=Corynebacterium kalidii TaxID=2931982 RepID=A0A9X1WFS4_9CORY|nr:NAD(P)H-binding protein [Corynebacterium kalidii]MCJ7858204.1 NAD(P)H-binding protein [Corynebacterium kalidii]